MACVPLLEEWLRKTQENGDAEEAQTLVLPTGETEQKAELRIAPTDRELDRAAARMDGGTAAGWDGIPMSLVKAAGEETRQTIRNLLKHIMVNAEIPESWKDSRCPGILPPSETASLRTALGFVESEDQRGSTRTQVETTKQRLEHWCRYGASR
ncbi:hypothetical protein MTO96_006504 [Rhipicephalus appendiculatus]